MAVKQTGQPSFLEALLPKGAGVNATRVSLLRKPKVSMANKTYGTVSPERQKEMSGLEFVKGLASGTLPLKHYRAAIMRHALPRVGIEIRPNSLGWTTIQLLIGLGLLGPLALLDYSTSIVSGWLGGH